MGYPPISLAPSPHCSLTHQSDVCPLLQSETRACQSIIALSAQFRMIFVFNVHACSGALAHPRCDAVTGGLMKCSHCSPRGKASGQAERGSCRATTPRGPADVVHAPPLDISLLGEVAVTRCYFKKHRIVLSENFIYWLAQRNLIYKIAYSSLLENTSSFLLEEHACAQLHGTL